MTDSLKWCYLIGLLLSVGITLCELTMHYNNKQTGLERIQCNGVHKVFVAGEWSFGPEKRGGFITDAGTIQFYLITGGTRSLQFR